MRKSINLLLIILSFSMLFFTTSCSSHKKLLLLNWGEYINMDLVAEFEELYDCEVVISLADSNDLFYSKVKSGTTVYDLVIPSDYMVSKMYKKDLLQPIDYQKLGFDTYNDYLNTFLPGVQGVINEMESITPNIKNYFVPYFWGTWGIMYDKTNNDIINAINKNQENIWKLMFEKNILPEDIRIGMYDTSRYVYAATMFYLNESPNIQSEEILNQAENILSNRRFTSWATDTLKKDIARGNLDLGFMWTGDFLDMLYQELKVKSIDEITFDILIPDDTIAFCDSFVITKHARNVDLAHEFIKFFLNPDVAYRNASIVGYCTPNLLAYDKITKYDLTITQEDFLTLLNDNLLSNLKVNPSNNNSFIIEGNYNNKTFILELDNINDLDLTITDEILDIDPLWLTNWSYAVNKYYPKYVTNDKGFTGTILSDFPREYIDKINTICNNAKS